MKCDSMAVDSFNQVIVLPIVVSSYIIINSRQYNTLWSLGVDQLIKCLRDYPLHTGYQSW